MIRSFFARRVTLISFSVLCAFGFIEFASKVVNDVFQLVEYRKNRDNILMDLNQINKWMRLNDPLRHTIFEDGPIPLLFYLVNGGLKFPFLYGPFISETDLSKLLIPDREVFVVSMNPVLKGFRNSSRNGYLVLREGNEYEIEVDEREVAVLSIEVSTLDEKQRNFIHTRFDELEESALRGLGVIFFKESETRLRFVGGDIELGIKVCRTACTDGWAVGSDVRITSSEKSYTLEMRNLKDKYPSLTTLSAKGNIILSKAGYYD